MRRSMYALVRVVDDARHDDPPERGVGLAVAAAVEAVPFVLVGAGVHGCGAAEVSEGHFAAEPFGVVARRDAQRGRAAGADAGEPDELGSGLFNDRAEHGVAVSHLSVEALDPLGEGAQRELGDRDGVSPAAGRSAAARFTSWMPVRSRSSSRTGSGAVETRLRIWLSAWS